MAKQTKTTSASPAKKLTNTQKKRLAQDINGLLLQLEDLKASVAVATKDVKSPLNKLKERLDSLAELGETESLRLQMAMDRLSKMMSMLSNILKKMRETQENIINNLK
jgi:hypothetical protein